MRLGSATAVTGPDGVALLDRDRRRAARGVQGRARPRLPARGRRRMRWLALLAVPARRRLRLRRGRDARRRVAHGDARLRRRAPARRHRRGDRRGGRHGDAPAAGELRGRDALRRRVRAGGRRHRRRPRETAGRPTGSTTSTGSRRPSGRPSAASTAGERVWWDHHRWQAAQRVPAVVGSFPEPFLTGLEGKRFPVKLVCAGDAERTCDEVETRLQDSRRRRGLALGDPAVGGRGGPAHDGRPLDRAARGHRHARARAGAGGDRRVRSAQQRRRPDRAARRQRPDRAHAARGRRPGGGDQRRGRRRRPGSSPAPTRSVSPRPRRR